MRASGVIPQAVATRSLCRPAQVTRASAVMRSREVSTSTPAGRTHVLGHRLADADVVDAPGAGDVESCDTTDRRFDLTRLVDADNPGRHPVGRRARLEHPQGRQLGLVDAHDELAADGDRYAAVLGVRNH